MNATAQGSRQDTDRERARLYWQCRRGMLELDAMLQAFLDKHYSRLSDTERQALTTLLACPDQLLLDYLMGRTIPIDKEVARVAQQIHDAAGP